MVPELTDPYSIDCCCHSFVMGRCYSKDGIGIAQCDGGFVNDSIVSCKSLESPYPDINCFATADACSLYKQDKVDYVVFLVVGLVIFFLSFVLPFCYAGYLLASKINENEENEPTENTENNETQDAEDPIFHEEDEVKFSVLSCFRSKITGMAVFLYAMSVSMIILVCLMQGYKTTIYIMLGISVFGTIFFMLPPLVAIFIKQNEDEALILLTKSFTASNMYQDFTRSTTMVLLTCCCQLSLIGMYVDSVIFSGRPDFAESRAYAYFFLGTFIQFVYLQSIGSPLGYVNDEIQYWTKILLAFQGKDSVQIRVCYDNLLGYEKKEDMLELKMKSTLIRMVMSEFTNLFGLSFLQFILPIHLAHSSNAMEFLLNAVAAYYIVDIDDLKNEQAFEIVQTEDDIEASVLNEEAAEENIENKMDEFVGNPNSVDL